ncbi:hypothetical protein B0T22DRAFT_43200 [Podospora appendiculata]|uniref:Uncharacterized protein n=1 Tax=Podospora appendiculata TaxID=314037 RepID=A0AAE0XIF3_9PEZI|nr:hypothetical protein B0T22DRAFT_43200 [Podospora appendiculata]
MAAVAPMDLVMKSEPAAIPLKCTLCPKKPNFSDVSHLLTHISSKSHLSYRFKTELRSHSEKDARDAIRVYDDWYERNGIRGLLAERMAAKEQKRSTKSRRSSNAVKKPRAAVRDNGSIKTEPEDYTESPPPIAHWANASHASLFGHNTRQEYFDHAGYHAPALKRSQSDYSIPGTPDNMARRKYERLTSETETTESAVPSDLPSEMTEFFNDDEDDDDSSKLKGVRYPGMGLFDSASELQKRKRNQRKDVSVLRQMEETSAKIRPLETIWTEDGEEQRKRGIYDSPSIDGSPERVLEENHKKKRSRRVTTTTVTTKPRQTRSSARIARKAPKSRGGDDDDDDDDDLSLDQEENKDTSQISGHSHGSVENYDVFRDHPQLSPARNDSPLKGSGFELRRRPALQSMSSNIAMVSPALKVGKNGMHPYFPGRDSGPSTYPTHPPVPGNPYFPNQHALGGGNYNPLCVQTRPGYFNPYSYSNYATDSKPSAASFQPVNAMNPNLGGMSYNSFATPYTSDSPQERGHHDFDL